jgi:hypothetical protein
VLKSRSDAFNEDGGGKMAFGAYGTDGRRFSIHGASVKMRTPRKSCIVASSAAAEKKKTVPINKIPVRLVPLSNVKAVTSKIGSRDNVGYKLGGSRVNVHAYPIEAGLQQDAGGPCQSYISRAEDLDEI